MIDDGVDFPDLLTRRRIDGDQPAVVCANKHLALVEGDAAIDDVATALVADLAIHLGIVRPDALAGTHVDCVHDAP